MATEWMSNPLQRRAMLRGTGLGLAGLAGAALLGCGGSKSDSGASGGGGSAPAASNASGAPKNVKRADGFDPKYGEVPVNNRKFVKGGGYRRSASDTSPMKSRSDHSAGSWASMNARSSPRKRSSSGVNVKSIGAFPAARYPRGSPRPREAMMPRWISEVPPPMVARRESRKKRCIGYSMQ